MQATQSAVTLNDFHLFCGAGGGALGFRDAQFDFRGVPGRFECLGGVDVDPLACKDFEAFVGVKATCLDLFARDDWRAFHGREPPDTWREATADDISAAAQHRHPHVVFLSPPCKGFSGLISNAKHGSAKYQALNNLVVRGIFLMLEAFEARPPGLIILENVPRIVDRGAGLLEQVKRVLGAYGYAVNEQLHCCGETGGLAEKRKRYLLVARHVETVRPFLYQPPKFQLRPIGSDLDTMPMPEDPCGGPMHRLPNLKWNTWVRLALIPAGKDWKALNDVDHERIRIAPAGRKRHSNVYRVIDWDEPSTAVTAGAGPSSGGISVADPRWHRGVLGVLGWDSPIGTVTGRSGPTTGTFSFAVADPRLGCTPNGRTLRVVSWHGPAPTVIGQQDVWSSGGFCVSDPRLSIQPRNGVLGVMSWDGPALTVTGAIDVWAGTAAVADPREGTNGPPVIISQDDFWHRPLTTLELAKLQSLRVFDRDGLPLVLSGSASHQRELIGNMVPPAAARRIAEFMGRTILAALSGVGFLVDPGKIWVRHDLGEVIL